MAMKHVTLLAALLTFSAPSVASEEWGCWRWAQLAASVKDAMELRMHFEMVLEYIEMPEGEEAKARQVAAYVYQNWYAFSPNEVFVRYKESCEGRGPEASQVSIFR